MGAQPVYMAFVILLITLILDTLWASLLSIANMVIVAVLMLLESFEILKFMDISLPRELLISNLIHYSIVYLMLFGMGLVFKKNYKQFQHQYYRLSVIDDLTQLYNRRFLFESLEKLVSESQRHGQGFSILFINIDQFKQVNDREGHLVGDAVLRCLGEIIKNELRLYDIGGRYGGDEIMILLPHTTLEDARCIAERLKSKFVHQIASITQEPISLSSGLIESDNKTVEDIIKSADEAMYNQKKGLDVPM